MSNVNLFCRDSKCEADYVDNCKACSTQGVDSYIATACKDQLEEKNLSEYSNSQFISFKYMISVIFIILCFFN